MELESGFLIQDLATSINSINAFLYFSIHGREVFMIFLCIHFCIVGPEEKRVAVPADLYCIKRCVTGND